MLEYSMGPKNFIFWKYAISAFSVWCPFMIIRKKKAALWKKYSQNVGLTHLLTCASLYHVYGHFRVIPVYLGKRSIFTLKNGYFKLFFTKSPILAEYASAIEYSMGPEKIFSDQDCAYLQILVYGLIIRRLLYNRKVRSVRRISKDFPKNRNFWKIDRTSSGNKFFSFQDMKKL